MRARKLPDDYTLIRVGLINRGFTLASWARTKGYPVPTVYDAARGKRRGIKSTRIRKQLQAFIQ